MSARPPPRTRSGSLACSRACCANGPRQRRGTRWSTSSWPG